MNLVARNNRTNNRNSVFPSIMEEFLRPDWMGGVQSSTVPAVNIRETDTNFEVELSAPGKNKEDFTIEIDQDVLSISSESGSENTTTEGKYTRKEFSYTSFRRSFALPETVNEDEITASYESGILKISLPKREEALPKPKRAIEIR
jgi:HSP20 family protein